MKPLAKISGIAYLLIFVAGFYANFAVLESLVDRTNMSTTTVNFINNHTQFGYGLVGFAVMLFFDMVLVWSLYGLTKSVSKKLSYLASLFRFVHALLFSIALFNLYIIYESIFKVDYSVSLENKVTGLIEEFDTFWTVGLLFFGVHLIVLGYLAIKSSRMPKALGVLLLLGALGYIIDGTAKLFMENYSSFKDVFEMVVLIPAVVSELYLTIWLLVMGFNKKYFKY